MKKILLVARGGSGYTDRQVLEVMTRCDIVFTTMPQAVPVLEKILPYNTILIFGPYSPEVALAVWNVRNSHEEVDELHTIYPGMEKGVYERLGTTPEEIKWCLTEIVMYAKRLVGILNRDKTAYKPFVVKDMKTLKKHSTKEVV